MKTNLPVVDIQHAFPRGKTLVSKTDLEGVITYANDALLESTGYTREELIGQNHNIVRHPDMPAEVFADMWTAIKSGLPWQGMVKNRCKDGGFSWVKALIVPVRTHNKTIGHMSVRTEPTAEEIRAAAARYKAVMEKRARLKSFSLVEFISRFSFNARYGLFVTWMAALAIAAGVAGIQGWQMAAIALGATAVVSAIGSVWFMAVTVANPLREAIDFFDQIAQGNLQNDIPLNRPDEVGRVLAGLAVAQTHMRVMIDEIRLSTEDVESRCQRVERQVGKVTELSRDQANRVTAVSNSMMELSSSVTQVAQTAEASAASAKTAQEVVNEGNQRMARSIEATDEVASAVQTSGDDINKLSQSINQIGTLTSIVKDIADQTNLLALNAAIEAARAGEQGRGFAVVADEVRKLAERTATTTGDIDRMVADIQATARTTVETMGNAVERVQKGRELIEETHQSFNQITELSKNVTQISNGIAESARAQSAATEGVAHNTEQMSQLIEENSASFVEVNAAVHELRQTAGKLRDVVAHFQDRN